MNRLFLICDDFPDGRLEVQYLDLPVALGRSQRCQIPIEDTLLSRRHCEIRLNEAGRLEIHDLESTNLTIVNEHDIESHELQDGDQILIGETKIQVELVPVQTDESEQTTRDLSLLPGPNDETVDT